MSDVGTTNKKEVENKKDASSTNETITISKETIKRLLKDVKELIKEPLESDGIYYKHDESNILKGYVYICGPKDSQYFGGCYFFEFTFPYDYPHKPPKVEFKTNDGQTRFHPNMYRSGKICLSILNTWKGDQWTGCQSIRTILLTIVSIMDNMPLLHEPGFTEKHFDVAKYNKIILFKNFDFSVNRILSKDSGWSISPFHEIFETEMASEFKKNRADILTILEGKKDEPSENVRTGIYNLNIQINWKNTYEALCKLPTV
jgi:ubiquitin-protein ligase